MLRRTPEFHIYFIVGKNNRNLSWKVAFGKRFLSFYPLPSSYSIDIHFLQEFSLTLHHEAVSLFIRADSVFPCYPLTFPWLKTTHRWDSMFFSQTHPYLNLIYTNANALLSIRTINHKFNYILEIKFPYSCDFVEIRW